MTKKRREDMQDELDMGIRCAGCGITIKDSKSTGYVRVCEDCKSKERGWSVCNHYATDNKGLCHRCGYNTLHKPMSYFINS